MTKIQKVIREIEKLQDFYKRNRALRSRIQKKEIERLKEKLKKND